MCIYTLFGTTKVVTKFTEILHCNSSSVSGALHVFSHKLRDEVYTSIVLARLGRRGGRVFAPRAQTWRVFLTLRYCSGWRKQ